MKVTRKLDAALGETGEVKLCPMDADDMWNLYNLISVGDIVGAVTTRKVDKLTTAGSKSSGSERLVMFLYVKATAIDWDGTNNQLRVSGTVPDIQAGKGADYVKHGQFHTLQLEMQHDVVIRKEEWTSYDISRLHEATSNFTDCSTAAVVMELGLAHTCLITRTMCPTLAKIEQSIPKKTSNGIASGYDTAVKKFYTKVAESLAQIPQTITCFIIAGPAFVAQDFQQFLQSNIQYKDRYSWLFPLIRTTHASTGHKHSLLEALGSGQLTGVIKSSNFEVEQEEMVNFVQLLSIAENRAFYGLKDVKACIEQGYPITNLMILDTLFKAIDAQQRKEYINLVETVKKRGGKVTVFSSLNPTAEQLKQLTGIACVLQYDAEDLHGEQQQEEMQQYITTAMTYTPFNHSNQFDSNSNNTHDYSTDGIEFFLPTLKPQSLSHIKRDAPTPEDTATKTTSSTSEKKDKKSKKESNSNSAKSSSSSSSGKKESSSKKDKKSSKVNSGDKYEDLGDFL